MLQYTYLENYGKYIINLINGLLKLNENVYESGDVTRYTWKHNKLHDPCQRKCTPMGWREESSSE